MCATNSFPVGNSPRSRAFDEWTRVSAGRLCDYSGVTYDRIAAAGGVQWPCTATTQELAGTERLYTDGKFRTPNGRAKLHCVTNKPLYTGNRRNYPLILNTGRTVEHWHTAPKPDASQSSITSPQPAGSR